LHLSVEKANIEKRILFIVFGIVVAMVDIIFYIYCIHDKTIWIYVIGYYIKRNWEWVAQRLMLKMLILELFPSQYL